MKSSIALGLFAICLLSARADASCCECLGSTGACAAATECSNSPRLFIPPSTPFDALCVGAGCGSGFQCTADVECGQGEFAQCAPIGACNGIPGGACVPLSEGLCVANGGRYEGDGARCPITDAPIASRWLTATLTGLLLATGVLYLRRRRRLAS